MRLPRKLKKVAKAKRARAMTAVLHRYRYEIAIVQAQPMHSIAPPAAIVAKAIRCASIAMCAKYDFEVLKRKPLNAWIS